SALPGSERRKIGHRKPGGDAADRRRYAEGHESDIADRELDVRRMPPAVAERGDLLEPARRRVQRAPRESVRRRVEGFVDAQLIKRDGPLFTCPRVSRAMQQDRELLAVRCEEDEV